MYIFQRLCVTNCSCIRSLHHANSTETAIELRYLAKESKAKYNCTQRTREKEVRDLLDKIGLIEDELEIEKRACTMQTEFLQRKLHALTEKSLDVTSQNDKDTTDKTKMLEALQVQGHLACISLCLSPWFFSL